MKRGVQAGASGCTVDGMPKGFKVTRTSRGLRGLGSEDIATVKISLGKRILDRLI